MIPNSRSNEPIAPIGPPDSGRGNCREPGARPAYFLQQIEINHSTGGGTGHNSVAAIIHGDRIGAVLEIIAQ